MLLSLVIVFFFKQKTAYEMRISDWSSDVCSSDLLVDADIKLGLVVGGARDDERGARLVDQERIDLVEAAEVEGAMDHLHPLELHIVAQLIEAKLVIGRISDFSVIGYATLQPVDVRTHHAGAAAQAARDITPTSRIRVGQ